MGDLDDQDVGDSQAGLPLGRLGWSHWNNGYALRWRLPTSPPSRPVVLLSGVEDTPLPIDFSYLSAHPFEDERLLKCFVESLVSGSVLSRSER